MKKIFQLFVLMAGVFAAAGATASTNDVPWRVPLYSLNAKAMSVREVFNTFGVAGKNRLQALFGVVSRS